MTQQTDELIVIVTGVLQELGQPMTFSRAFEGVYDPETAEATTPMTAIYYAYGAPWPYSKYERANGLIETNDTRIVIHRTDENPIVGDNVNFDDIDYRVTRVERINMSGEKIAWMLELRS